MENSELEDMAIGRQMLSETTATTTQPSDGALTDNFLSSLNKNNSILSLTLDEIQCKSGKNFGGMSMDEFLANIWNAEEIQNQIHSQSNENEPQNHPFLPPNNTQQASFSIPIPLCGKTVDEIWSEIHKDQQQQQQQQHSHLLKFINVQRNPWQSQQALGEMTLEDFLVKAGVVQESSSSSMKQQQQQLMHCSPKQSNSNDNSNSNSNTIFGNNRSSMVDLGFGMGDKLGLSLTYQQNAARNMSGNCFSTYQMLAQSIGEPSDHSSIQKCQSLTDWVEHSSSKKRIIDGPPEVVVQRRQRRMIKNRESAARSRARKQVFVPVCIA